MEEEVVGYLRVGEVADESYNVYRNIEICGSEKFTIGRDPTCRYTWPNDLAISREHLRIHSILYESISAGSHAVDIAPLVYATDISSNGTQIRIKRWSILRSPHGVFDMDTSVPYLLEDGDQLFLSKNLKLTYYSRININKFKFTATQERELHVFAEKYLVTDRLLGKGANGNVLLCFNKRNQAQLVCKIVNLEAMQGEIPLLSSDLPPQALEGTLVSTKSRRTTTIIASFREFDTLKQLRHPNIINLEKVFWSHNNIYIFQTLATGGDLFSYIQCKGGHLTEDRAGFCIRQILEGVQYLHDQDIVHRDLKPENILMTSLEDDARAVITDFGHARFLPGNNQTDNEGENKVRRMFSRVGTLGYAAPEVFETARRGRGVTGYTKSIDMWSVGSITASVLTGSFFFTNVNAVGLDRNNEHPTNNMKLAAQCDLGVLDDAKHPEWQYIGNRPKDFIKRLLVIEEHKRMTADQALKHPWLRTERFVAEGAVLSDQTLRDREQFKNDGEQLVERVTNISKGSLGRATKQVMLPPALSSPSQSLNHAMLPKPQRSVGKRNNTPLPSIQEEYDHAYRTYRRQEELHLSTDPFRAANMHNSDDVDKPATSPWHRTSQDAREMTRNRFLSQSNHHDSLPNSNTLMDDALSQFSYDSVQLLDNGYNFKDEIVEYAEHSEQSLHHHMDEFSQSDCDAVQTSLQENAQQAVINVMDSLASHYDHAENNADETDASQLEEAKLQPDSLIVLETPPAVFRHQKRRLSDSQDSCRILRAEWEEYSPSELPTRELPIHERASAQRRKVARIVY